ncbi:unnamed protein product [Ilex paraguariensis]|uniref:Uncharacterized protein n=1 Tax=Ilex paraguariensis TaxID=185542 RepID=A0ABC8RSV6_9AQUA
MPQPGNSGEEHSSGEDHLLDEDHSNEGFCKSEDPKFQLALSYLNPKSPFPINPNLSVTLSTPPTKSTQAQATNSVEDHSFDEDHLLNEDHSNEGF